MSPITSIVAAVAGDNVTIEGIVPEGTNSHTFEPEPQAAELLSTADLIFINGLKLEDPTLGLAEANKKEGAEIVELGTVVAPAGVAVHSHRAWALEFLTRVSSAEKSVDAEGRHLVHVKHLMENQRGVKMCTGTAEIWLPKKAG